LEIHLKISLKRPRDWFLKKSFYTSQIGKMLAQVIKERLEKSEPGLGPAKQEKYYCKESLDTDKIYFVTIVGSDFLSREKTVSLILCDITLELAQEDKRIENRFKNMMLYSLSPELRTPLNILQDALKLSKNMIITPDEKERYESGKGAWNYLRNKINDTLAYAQLLTGKFELHEIKFSFSRFSKYLLKPDMGNFIYNAKEKVRLEFNVSPFLKDEFTGDRERLEQVLFNLLQNAVKYTDLGIISLSIYYDNEARKNIIFTVKDTGCGMNKIMLDSILKMSTPKAGRPGSGFINIKNFIDNKICGLGLTISMMIIHKNRRQNSNYL